LSTESNKSSPTEKPDANAYQEQALEKMEAILNQAAMGIHLLFDKATIASAYKDATDEKDFYDFDKVKVIQDTMTELIAKKTYFEKLAYLQALDKGTLVLLIRAYFHIVENNVLASQQKH
jgi:hypothetical protein